MPSDQLAFLSDSIELQATDHLGKFYLYVALLDNLTVRDKPFNEGVPKHGFFWKEGIHIGEISSEFMEALNAYSREFRNPQLDSVKSINNILMMYLRKGTVSDLLYIIDKMLSHLEAMHGPYVHNQAVARNIHFETIQPKLIAFFKEISDFNHQALSLVDNGCNSALSFLTMILGAATIPLLNPAICCLLIMGGGAFGTFHLLNATNLEIYTRLDQQLVEILQQAKELYSEVERLPKAKLLGKNPSIFYKAAIEPLPFTVITIAEQLIPSAQKKFADLRDKINKGPCN